MTVDPALFTFIAIVIFGCGVVIGYLFGWDDGVSRGFDVGWREAKDLVLREIAKSRKDPAS